MQTELGTDSTHHGSIVATVIQSAFEARDALANGDGYIEGSLPGEQFALP